jgi:hypothetical protein
MAHTIRSNPVGSQPLVSLHKFLFKFMQLPPPLVIQGGWYPVQAPSICPTTKTVVKLNRNPSVSREVSYSICIYFVVTELISILF